MVRCVMKVALKCTCVDEYVLGSLITKGLVKLDFHFSHSLFQL